MTSSVFRQCLNGWQGRAKVGVGWVILRFPYTMKLKSKRWPPSPSLPSAAPFHLFFGDRMICYPSILFRVVYFIMVTLDDWFPAFPVYSFYDNFQTMAKDSLPSLRLPNNPNSQSDICHSIPSWAKTQQWLDSDVMVYWTLTDILELLCRIPGDSAMVETE